MATIKLTHDSEHSLEMFMDYCASNFGNKACKKLQDKINKKIVQLAQFPLSCSPEPYLYGHPENYRSCVIQKPIKMIYHYVEAIDTLYIDNFWDMRRNPDALKGDI